MNDEFEEHRFRKEVSRSWQAVWAVAQHIHSCGDWQIRVQPLRLRPDIEQRDGFGDAADLFIAKLGAQWMPVEVKWRDLDFTDGFDFPYPTIFIDRSRKSDAAHPAGYVMVNRDLTHAAQINWSTRQFWLGPNTYFDNVKGYEVTVYECPLDHVRFYNLNPRGGTL